MPDDLTHEEFRAQVQGFLATALPHHLSEKVLGHIPLEPDDILEWQRILRGRGWIAPNWPLEYGGTGWSAEQQRIFDEECCVAGAPETLPFGLRMVAPVLFTYGTEAQKERYLPRILDSDDWWCQGFSEPDSGSDLASLRTRAELSPDGAAFVVNGQKTWTTYAQHANTMFCLVRTDPQAPRPQLGISFLIIDMTTPGVTVSPIRTLDGGQEINDVFFDNVHVPIDNLVGQLHGGWNCAKLLLDHERLGAARVGRSRRELNFLTRVAAQRTVGGIPLAARPDVAERIANLEIELLALEQTSRRLGETMRAGKGHGAEASILKYLGTSLVLRILELDIELAGPHTLPVRKRSSSDTQLDSVAGPRWADPLARFHLNFRKIAIYGGSSEIQKNIIAQKAFRL
ncbi:acyl-CoA dehydrogenase family protein [Rhodococcus koreensis]|uniref:acyl-CoA dehydrogenase family protein n=1 Tax=Rhodococcus koreensis TaxID=99653 RepID=UPI0036DDF370